MTIPQSQVAPIVSNSNLDIVTLKNVVALDVVEQNENILRAFQLLHDSNRKITLNRDLTVDSLKKRVEELKKASEMEAIDLDAYKNSLESERLGNKNTQLLRRLADDFGRDYEQGVAVEDDIEALVKEYEQHNDTKVKFDELQLGYYKIKEQVQGEAKKKDTDIVLAYADKREPSKEQLNTEGEGEDSQATQQLDLTSSQSEPQAQSTQAPQETQVNTQFAQAPVEPRDIEMTDASATAQPPSTS